MTLILYSSSANCELLPGRSVDVCAVIVTHDPERVLKESIRGVCSQTARVSLVVVIDNGSLTGVLTHLEDRFSHPPIKVVRLPMNTGPAGGYAFGIAAALEAGTGFLWIMDDDVIPDPCCLAFLLREAKTCQVVWPTVYDSSRKILPYPAWAGVLVSREVPDLVGLPNVGYFWWAEDTEYLSYRFRNCADIQACCSPGAVVEHRRQIRRERALWKYYYEVRNSVHFRTHARSITMRGIRKLVVSIVLLFCKAAIEPCRVSKLRSCVLGFIDGCRGRLGVRFDV